MPNLSMSIGCFERKLCFPRVCRHARWSKRGSLSQYCSNATNNVQQYHATDDFLHLLWPPFNLTMYHHRALILQFLYVRTDYTWGRSLGQAPSPQCGKDPDTRAHTHIHRQSRAIWHNGIVMTSFQQFLACNDKRCCWVNLARVCWEPCTLPCGVLYPFICIYMHITDIRIFPTLTHYWKLMSALTLGDLVLSECIGTWPHQKRAHHSIRRWCFTDCGALTETLAAMILQVRTR